jgi:hypothetical protein
LNLCALQFVKWSLLFLLYFSRNIILAP